MIKLDSTLLKNYILPILLEAWHERYPKSHWNKKKWYGNNCISDLAILNPLQLDSVR